MIDQEATQLALRNRAIGVVVCTTGSTSLSATATGYNRAAGSFVADGFERGMEVLPAGFASNTPGQITAVTATDITIKGGRNVEGAAGGRTLTVGLPALRAWENRRFEPIVGRLYVEEDLVMAAPELISAPFAGGTNQENGLYLLRLYGLSGVGVAAIRKYARALLQRFAPGTPIAVGSDSLRIDSDSGPWASRLEPLQGGWTAVEIAIPWYAWSVNTLQP